MKLTKKILQKYNACDAGYKWYLENGCDTVEKTVKKLIAEERFRWANWLIANTLTRKNKVKYAVYAAELVLDIYEAKHPEDNRPRKAIEAAKAWIKNPCKETKRAAYNAANIAYDAAHTATYDVYASYAAAANASYAAAATKDYIVANCAYAAATTNARLGIEKIIKYGLLLLK